MEKSCTSRSRVAPTTDMPRPVLNFVDEIAFLLGHRDANVTRAVYVRELADTRRRSMRRSRMLAEYADLLKQ